jgi:hypothetical protein
MKGTFSEEALLQFANLASQTQSADFSEGETYDFTRCVKPDGKAYGTAGKCKKGTEQAKDAEEHKAIKQLGGMLPKGEQIMDSKGKLHTAAGKGEEAPKGSSGINLAKVRAAKEKLAADKKANGGKRLDRIQEEQRLARNKAQRELDAKGKAEGTTAAARVARPVNSEVALQVDRAMARKNGDVEAEKRADKALREMRRANREVGKR